MRNYGPFNSDIVLKIFLVLQNIYGNKQDNIQLLVSLYASSGIDVSRRLCAVKHRVRAVPVVNTHQMFRRQSVSKL